VTTVTEAENVPWHWTGEAHGVGVAVGLIRGGTVVDALEGVEGLVVLEPRAGHGHDRASCKPVLGVNVIVGPAADALATPRS